jgi:hypothetical protein
MHELQAEAAESLETEAMCNMRGIVYRKTWESNLLFPILLAGSQSTHLA